ARALPDIPTFFRTRALPCPRWARSSARRGLEATWRRKPPPPASCRQKEQRLFVPRLFVSLGDPLPEHLGVDAAEAAQTVQLGQHQLGAFGVAPLDLQLAVIFGGAAVIGRDRQRLAVIALGPAVAAHLAIGVADIGEHVGLGAERALGRRQRLQRLGII